MILISVNELLIIIIIEKYSLVFALIPFELFHFLVDINQFNFYLKINGTLLLIIEIGYCIVKSFFIVVFLEFIELNFCGLNIYLKKNILNRADEDRFTSPFIDEDKTINTEDYIISIEDKEDDESDKYKSEIEFNNLKK